MITSIDAVQLHIVNLPIRTPFTTSFSTQTVRTILLVEMQVTIDGDQVTGWGECVALPDPVYSSEYIDGAREVISRYLIPALLQHHREHGLTAETVSHALRHIIGHRMAKGALEMAVLDAQLRAARLSLASYLGAVADRVPSGVSVGIMKDIPELLRAVEGYLDAGYQRIKLKIMPGWDIEPVHAVRQAFGEVPLQVDANTAYTLHDAQHLRGLDKFDLLLIEQPLGDEDLRQHAELARILATPMCLDESIVDAQSAADAIALGAAAVINVKPGRVGGYLEARRIHDLSRAHGVPVWCGGMLETGLGRAANAALAALPGFTVTGDISGSDRFYVRDLTEPVLMKDGFVPVSQEPGVGPAPIPEVLTELTTHHSEVALG